MTIYDVLKHGTIVYSQDKTCTLITWNGSLTFNIFVETELGLFDNIDCFIASSVKSTKDASHRAALYVGHDSELW